MTWNASATSHAAMAAITSEMQKVIGELTPNSEALAGIHRILPVIAHAVAVFGDEQKASQWLETPLPLLADRSPAQLLESAEGIELVEQVLTRIEHNIPS